MTITVHCPSCETGFPVDPAKIPEAGVKVRCTVCSEIFRVERPAEPDEALVEKTPVTPVEATPRPGPEVPADDQVASTDDQSGPADEHSAPMDDRVDDLPAGEDDWGTATGDDWGATSEDDWGTASEDDWGTSVDEGRGTGSTDEAPAADHAAGGDPPRTGEEAATERTSADDGSDGSDDDGGWGVTSNDDWGGAGSSTAENASEVGGNAAGTDPSLQDPDSWVIEVDEEIDPADVEIERVGTVEDTVEEARGEVDPGGERQSVVPGGEDAAFSGYRGSDPPVAESPVTSEVEEEPTPDAGAGREPSAPVGFQFGKRDPHEKARRLARVLVSDMITYNPERHTRALEQGTVKADFEEEIEKSWEEYVGQVGSEIAEGTDYWRNALNDVLAKGDELF